jgi:hypothetical protein
MMLQRRHDRKTKEVVGVRALRVHNHQHFSPRVVEAGSSEGWLLRLRDEIRIRQIKGSEIVYRIMRTPGPYCQCGKKIHDVKVGCCGGRYEYINYFDCERI